MAEKILMPRLSDTMTEGVIAAWHKNVGDTVKKGDLLAEIETDKATMELESYKDGVLLHRGAEEGGKLQVNDLLAIVGDKGEDVSGLIGGNGKAASDKPQAAGKEEKAAAKEPETTNQQPEAKAQSSTEKVDISKMDEVVLMPRLSDTMTEGVIASWQKNVGDDVKKGDILAEIETDKATMELESYKDGKLLYQGAKQGEKIAVNDLLAIIGKEGFDVNKVVNAAKGGSAEADTPAETKKETAAPQPEAKQEAAPEQEVVNEGRILASPLAKKLAEEKGIDLKYVKGSGDNGRITKADIDNYQQPAAGGKPQVASDEPKAAAQSQPAEVKPQETAPAKQAQPVVATASYGKEEFEEVPVSQMRKTIARRLAESKFSAPHFYLTMSIDMDACVAARKRINDVSPVKISFNDMVLKAVAVALRQHPKVNSSWLGDKIRVNKHISIGVAVAVDEGLLVPVVRFADTKQLSQIATEVKTLADKAKNKKLQPAEWEGSTFTISNLGMFGIEEFTAIINPPDACILAVGGISQIPVVKNGTIVPGNVMKVTLSCDHRVVDGATGAAFLQTLKSLLEEPLRMLV
ncbi:pyruvate dehydrogenase complex dihydrolipoamide acetyltransferase [Parafilimonas terrae]|uniref:Acetyltransferase component of pyruvate dehydrogenase complex n=1 Tax=Parafilimonas terrae TaxID=1465490 RepID=A0A1I5WAL1_9BACT|nr:pyruvate dehydrogenase complex dihydrolipoamide acetyltransferase [Parafilimonas terrae]SFQ16749.1 pyruvate dehydrogenase E2 component (dihydrolipoamide acetyltransferase) [Parafilimonas terrae]